MPDRAPRILLVDDEQPIQTLLSFPLQRDGYEVVVASDGRESLSRVKAALRRAGMPRAESDDERPVEVRGLRIDPAKRAVTRDGEAVATTYVEFEILRALANAPGRVFTRDMLLSRVWGDSAFRDPRTIDVHIRHLREKIESDPKEPEF